MPKKTTKKRPIDQAATKSLRSWGEKFIFISTKEVKSWQAIFVVAFLSGILATLIWTIPSGFHATAKAQDVGIFWAPATACRAFPIGGEFNTPTDVGIKCGRLVKKATFQWSGDTAQTIVNEAWNTPNILHFASTNYQATSTQTLTLKGQWHFWFFMINFPIKTYTFERGGELLIEDVSTSEQVQSNMVYASDSSNTNEVELLKFKLTATSESVDISRFIFNDTIISSELGATTAYGKPITSLLNFKLYDDTGLIAGPTALISTSTLTNDGYISFNLGYGNGYNVPVWSEKILTLKATVNAWQWISSGATHTLSIESDPLNDGSTKAITARGHNSGANMSGPGSSIIGNAMTTRKAYPIITRDALPTTTLHPGTTEGTTIAKFKVTASGNQVRLKKISMKINLHDTTMSTLMSLSRFKMYRNGVLMSPTEYSIFNGTGTSLADELSHSGTASLNASSSSNSIIPIMFTTRDLLVAGGTGAGEETIANGTTNTYELKCTVTNAHQGNPATDADAIAVQLLGDDRNAPYTGDLTHLYPYGIVGLGNDYGATSTNFVWSDYSANTGDHTSTIPSISNDWTNGYQVRATAATPAYYIPLDSWVLSR